MVLLDGSAAGDRRLDTAVAIAARFDAHVTGLLVVSTPPVAARRDRAEALERRFRSVAAAAGVEAEWTSPLCAPGDLTQLILAAARAADIAVVGQQSAPEFDAWPPAPPELGPFYPVLLRAGVPVIVVPNAGQSIALGERIMIAWRNSREAARAIHDGLPLLALAREVTLFTVYLPDDDPAAERASMTAVLGLLASRGIRPRLARAFASWANAGDVIMDYAAEIGADLIIMGGYGYARRRNVVLGDVTRRLLERMTVPVLMSH